MAFVDHLDHRRQAVGGARRRSDDAVLRGVVQVVVDADHDVEHIAHLHGRGDDDTFGATVEVALQGLGAQELAGALQHQVDTQVPPGDLGRGGVRREAEPAVVDADRGLAVGGDVGPPAALHAVELHQVCSGCGTALEFVEVGHLQPVARARVVRLALGGAHRGAKRQTADAAHSVDAHSHAVYPVAVPREVSNASSTMEIYGSFVTVG